MKKVFKFIFNEILYNGHLQTMGALAVVIFSSLLFNIKITWDLLFILYLSFYAVYLYNRYEEINIDYLTNKKRTEHLQKFKNHIPAIIIILLACLIIFLILFANFSFIIFISVIIIFGFLYTDFFKKLTKNIIIFKNIYVASVFAILVICPFIYYSLPFKNFLAGITALMAFIFLRAILMQIFLDVKDIKSDKEEGLLTMGVMFGKEKTLKILSAGNAVTAGLLPVIFWYLNIFSSSFLMLLFLVPVNIYFLNLLKKEKFLCFALESGEFIILPILILLGDNLL